MMICIVWLDFHPQDLMATAHSALSTLCHSLSTCDGMDRGGHGSQEAAEKQGHFFLFIGPIKKTALLFEDADARF